MPHLFTFVRWIKFTIPQVYLLEDVILYHFWGRMREIILDLPESAATDVLLDAATKVQEENGPESYC